MTMAEEWVMACLCLLAGVKHDIVANWELVYETSC